jgi:hypothetical protein
MDNETFAVTWTCSKCKHENKVRFIDMDWQITRDPCNDIDGMYVFDVCEICGKEDRSITNLE